MKKSRVTDNTKKIHFSRRHTMLSLASSTFARRGAGIFGTIMVTRRAVPATATTTFFHQKRFLYTRPKERTDEEKADFRFGFYGDENPEMREFFDSMEDKIEEILNPTLTPQEQKSLMAQARRTFAVDSPDGSSDGSMAIEIQEIHKILDRAVNRQRELHVRIDTLTDRVRARKAAAAAYAVDSPDGEDDGHVQEELQEVDRIIQDSVLKKESMSDKDKEMLKQRASDPEHW